MGFIDTILVLVSLYLGLGAIFGAAFVTKGIARIDRVAKESSPAFRALILPGSAVLWPILALKWIRANRSHSLGTKL